MEWTNAAENVIVGLLHGVEGDANMTAFRMHHTMYALAIDDQSDTNPRANSHIAQRFLYTDPIAATLPLLR